MAKLNDNVKKLKHGELAGTVAIAFCLLVIIYFAVCFTIARVQDIKALQLATLITSPILLVAGAGVAAFCNLKYGRALDKAIAEYVRQTFIENAPLMHPERNSLTFYISLEGSEAQIQINGYNEKITFDFSPLGKLSPARRLSILTAIENRLVITFCRLYERGASYTDVSFTERTGRKSGKVNRVISAGEPDKKAFKLYLKSSN